MKHSASPFEKEYKYCPSCRTKLERKRIDRRNLLNCPKCGFIFWNNPKPVVSVLLEKGEKVLMLQRKQEPLKNYWVMPGGFIDYEETPEEAAIRETKEETGLKIKIDKIIGVYQIDNDPRGIHLDIIFKGTILSKNLRLNEESSRFEFLSHKRLPRLIAYKHRQAIEL